jgi:hypothetical protein
MKYTLSGTLCVLLILSCMTGLDLLVVALIDNSMSSVTMIIFGTAFISLFLFYFSYQIVMMTLGKIE